MISQPVLLFLSLAVASALPSAGRAANPADFTVQGANRKETFRLADAKGKFVALHFLLKTECPFCVRHTRDYVEKAKSRPGVIHVFLKPDSEADIAKWANKLGPDPATIFRDPGAKLAEAFGIPGGYRFHGQVVHYPALVLLDPSGKEVFRHVGKSNSDRLSFAAFSVKLKEYQRP